MLTCLRGGQLVSKPMTVLRHDFEGPFWFFMRDPGPQDEADFANVNLSFANPGDGHFVSISGHGQVVRDRQRIHRWWTPMAKPYFPEGPDAPDLALLRVDPTEGEFWDGPSNAVSRGLALAASIFKGRPVGMGEHAEVRFDTR